MSNALLDFVKKIKPALSVNLDAVCVIDQDRNVVYMNLAMKNFLKIRGREAKKKVPVQGLIQADLYELNGPLDRLMKNGKAFRNDEFPVARGNEKYRACVKAVPIFDVGAGRGAQPLGAIMTIRDTSAELLVHAKYKKLLQLLDEKNREIAEITGVDSTKRAA